MHLSNHSVKTLSNHVHAQIIDGKEYQGQAWAEK